DLSRRGHVRLEPVRTTDRLGRRREDLIVTRSEPAAADTLRPHERLLLNFLLKTIAGGAPELRLSTLDRWFRKHQEETRAFLSRWHDELNKRSEELGFWKLPPEEHRRWRRDRTLLFLGSGAVIVLLFLLNDWIYWSAFVLWPLSVAGLLAALFARRRSQFGSDQKAQIGRAHV